MKNAHTLIELMVVVVILVLLLGALFTALTNSDTSWRLGQNKLSEQEDARKGLDNITRLLRQSNPQWIVSAVSYPITISDGGKRIDFYQPIFDASDNISSLKKVTFKLNPSDTRQLLKKEGVSDPVVVANNIESLNFGGGCPGCAVFNCLSVDNDCPVVKVDILTKKCRSFEHDHPAFSLSSQVAIRNYDISISSEIPIEEPGEGEF